MKLVRFLFRTAPALVVLAVIVGLVAGATNSALIAMINRVVTRADWASSKLLWMFVGLALLLPTARSLSSFLLVRLSQQAIFDLRMHLTERILAAPLRRLEEVGGARLLAALTDDVRTITTAMISIPALCIQVAIVLGCLAYLCWLSWPVFLAILALLLVSVVAIQIPNRRAQVFLRRSRETQDRLFRHFRAITDGNKEMKLHRGRREAFVAGPLTEASNDYRRDNVIGNTIYALAGSWSQLIFFAAVGALLFAVPRLVKVDQEVLMGYVLTMIYIMVPLDVIFDTLIPTMARAEVSLRKIDSLGLSLAAVTREDPTSPLGTPAWRSIDLVGVSHTFRGEKEGTSFVLGPLDLSFRPGELVFIVGGNGSGKTTLAKVILGLYAPESGELRLDGVPVTDADRDAYRQHFSAVFSDFFLFDSLLGLNLPRLDEQAREYLEKLQIEGKVEVSSGALSTLDLSQGQRKRLALLTAYLEDRPIYLFDEWAADQDPTFKKTFYHQLLPELRARGKTVLVISHDDHYYHLADRIIKLDYGQVELDAPARELSMPGLSQAAVQPVAAF